MASSEGAIRIETLAATPQKPISESFRFLVLVIGSFGCICCSFSYAFNLISGSMQQRYGLSQRDISTISTVGLVFQYSVLPYGFIYDYLGPLPVAIIATVYLPLGALLLALCFQGAIVGSVVRLSVFNAILGAGCAVFDLASCMTVLSYFPTHKGPVTALLKTFTGLGTAIVGSMQAGFFTTHVDWYFYFLMSFAFVTGVLCVFLMRLPAYHMTNYQLSHLSEDEKARRLATKVQYLKQQPPLWRFVLGFVILIVLIAYLPMESALVAYLGLGRRFQIAFGVVSAALTGLYMLVAFPTTLGNHRTATAAAASGNVYPEDEQELPAALPADVDTEEPLADALDLSAADTANQNKSSNADVAMDAAEKPLSIVQASSVLDADCGETQETELDYLAPQYQESFYHNLLSPRLWGLFWTLFCVAGTEFVIIFNASYILGAIAGELPSDSLRTLLTVLNGVGSAVGRLLMSYFESWTQRRKAEDRIPITIALFFPTTSIIVTIVLFLVLPTAALPLPYVIAALGNGFLAATTILVTRTIFAQDPAKHYNFCFMASTLAAITLNRCLYGEYTTRQAEKQNSRYCFGKKRCVMMPLLVLLGLACSAFISNVYVHFTYRRFCQKALAERARIREAALNRSCSSEEPAIHDGLAHEEQ